jgi:hypothetical protein
LWRAFPETDERLLGVIMDKTATKEGPVSAQEHEPTGTVRREPVRGALAVCVTGGYRVMFPDHDQVMVLSHAGDSESLGVYDWPIIWCPNAAYHEQDNIRRAQGTKPYQP